MTDLSPPSRPVDSLTERLQARVELLEARPELTNGAATRRGRLETSTIPRPDSRDGATAIDDLDAQLDLLRSQLDAAFDAVEARLAAAEAKADTADTRAQVASARAANVLASIDELAAELTRFAEIADPDDIRGLRSAVDRARVRLQPT